LPDWILAALRGAWAPVRWAGRRFRRHALDRHALVREGSEVVTPVIEFTRSAGPGSIMFGTDEYSDLCRAWQAFSYDDEVGGHTVRRGVRLLGSHDAVRRYAWNFVLDSEPDDAEPSPYPLVLEPEARRFTGATKLKLKVPVLHGPQKYEPGTVAEFPAGTASWLVGENYAEVA
jgi:hypothetical protein